MGVKINSFSCSGRKWPVYGVGIDSLLDCIRADNHLVFVWDRNWLVFCVGSRSWLDLSVGDGTWIDFSVGRHWIGCCVGGRNWLGFSLGIGNSLDLCGSRKWISFSLRIVVNLSLTWEWGSNWFDFSDGIQINLVFVRGNEIDWVSEWGSKLTFFVPRWKLTSFFRAGRNSFVSRYGSKVTWFLRSDKKMFAFNVDLAFARAVKLTWYASRKSLLLVSASILNWYLWGWSRLTWFHCRWLPVTSFQCTDEIDEALAWVVGIDLISAYWSELTCFLCVGRNFLVLVSVS